MTHFGTVESFDASSGQGLIKQEEGGRTIAFERKAFSWADQTPPPVGKRLSYEVQEVDGVTSAINLQNA